MHAGMQASFEAQSQMLRLTVSNYASRRGGPGKISL
jgi:hypothetical protein